LISGVQPRLLRPTGGRRNKGLRVFSSYTPTSTTAYADVEGNLDCAGTPFPPALFAVLPQRISRSRHYGEILAQHRCRNVICPSVGVLLGRMTKVPVTRPIPVFFLFFSTRATPCCGKSWVFCVPFGLVFVPINGIGSRTWRRPYTTAGLGCPAYALRSDERRGKRGNQVGPHFPDGRNVAVKDCCKPKINKGLPFPPFRSSRGACRDRKPPDWAFDQTLLQSFSTAFKAHSRETPWRTTEISPRQKPRAKSQAFSSVKKDPQIWTGLAETDAQYEYVGGGSVR